MTEEKKTVADVTKERMLFDILKGLRTMQQIISELDTNKNKLIEDNCDRSWYPCLSGKLWREVNDAIDKCLLELGKCAEKKNDKNEE